MLRYALIVLSLAGSGSLFGMTDPDAKHVGDSAPLTQKKQQGNTSDTAVVTQTNNQKEAAQQAAQQAIQAHMAQVAANKSYQPGD